MKFHETIGIDREENSEIALELKLEKAYDRARAEVESFIDLGVEGLDPKYADSLLAHIRAIDPHTYVKDILDIEARAPEEYPGKPISSREWLANAYILRGISGAFQKVLYQEIDKDDDKSSGAMFALSLQVCAMLMDKRLNIKH